MQIKFLLTGAFLSLAVAGGAGATDILVAPLFGDEMPPVPVDTWSGAYGGVHIGTGTFTGRAIDWGYNVFAGPDGDIDLNAFALLGGVQAGYNYQQGNILYGIEADWSRTGFSEDRLLKHNLHYVKAQMDWLATLRGRLGVAEGNALTYVTGGLALAQLDHCGNANGANPCSVDGRDDIAWDGIRLGLVAGAGVEARLSQHWSLKGEYLFVQMDKENVVYDEVNDEDIDFSNRSHQLRVGLNYHFSGLPTADVVSEGPWSGLYGGVHIGTGAFTGQAMDWHESVSAGPEGDLDLNSFATLAGLQIGYNYQNGNVLYGIEADWSWTGFSEDRSFGGNNHYVKAQMDWLATQRGRLGVAGGNALAYVTGGLALAQLDHCANARGTNPCSVDGKDDIAWDGIKLGLVAGAGVEARLSPHWSLKGEYLFVQMDKENVVYDEANDHDIDFSNRSHQLRIGLNYHFSGLPMADAASSGPWSGLYGGVHAGGGAFTGQAMDWDYGVFEDPDGDIDLNSFAALGGLQAGYNYQQGNMLHGIEADWAWIGFSEDRLIDNDYYVKAQMDWLATLRGRLGLAKGNGLAYVTGGLALAQLDHCANYDGTAPCSVDSVENTAWDGTRLGLVAGAGVEAMLSERWSLKGEYLFVQMEKENVIYDEVNDFDIDFSNRSHQFRVGLNYHFGD